MGLRLENPNSLLHGSGLPGLTELHLVLCELLNSEPNKQLLEQRELRRRRVYRLRFGTDRGIRSLIVKRMDLATAQRNHLIVARWLPAVDLSESAAALAGIAAARDGQCVWHVYEDLGDAALDGGADRERVRTAVELIAQIHTRFAGHPLLPK